jgi:hypothetical protein
MGLEVLYRFVLDLHRIGLNWIEADQVSAYLLTGR